MAFRTTESKFYYQGSNGENLDLNPLQFTQNLAGGVLERVKSVKKVAVSVLTDASVGVPFFVDGNVLYRTSGSFVDAGFWVGDTISVFNESIGGGWIFEDREITSISNDGLQVYFDGLPVAAVGFGSGSCYNKTPLRAFQLGFGIIQNDESFNVISKIDGSSQQFYSPTEVGAGPVGARDTSFQDCIPLGTTRSWLTKDQVRVRFVQDLPFTELEGYPQEFEIEHTFEIVPFVLDGELGNLQNDILPELFQNNNSLKYAFEAEFKTSNSNPNTAKTGRFEQSLGAVSWFNRNFNNLNNQYSVDSVDHTDDLTAQVVDSIQVGAITNNTLVLNSADGTFVNGQRVILDVFYLASESEYLPNPDDPASSVVSTHDVHENFIWEKVVLQIGLGSSSSGFIIDASATLLGPSQIQIDFQTQYSASEQLRLDQTKYYGIAVNLSDQSVGPEFTDKVPLLCEVKEYTKSVDVPDLFTVNGNIRVFPHNQNIGVDSGYTDFKGWVEDGVVLQIPFGLNLDQIARVQSLEVGVIAYNPIDGDLFVIDKFNISLSSQVLAPNGTQYFTLDGTRNYKLEDGSQFNTLQLGHQGTTFIKPSTVEPGVDITYNGYLLTCGYKIPWQEWDSIQANTSFFNPSQENNGLNKNTSNYAGSTLPDTTPNPYIVAMSVMASVLVANEDSNDFGTVTQYTSITSACTVNDYSEGSSFPGWAVSIGTSTVGGADLEGNIADSENTLITTTYTPSGGDTSIITDPYGIDRFDNANGGPISIRELSSIRGSESDNPLVPVAGETFLKLTDNGTEIVTESMIDFNRIDPTIGKRITSRLGCLSSSGGIPPGAKITESGIVKVTESGDIKVIE